MKSPAPTIRIAAEADIPRIIEMGRKFWALTDYRSVEYDAGSIEHWSKLMIDQGLLLVAEVDGEVVGSVGALSAPLLGNVKYRVASELFWWLEPEHRTVGLGAALLIGIEGAAKAQGVKFFNMIALNAVEPERAAQVYLERGYKLTEWSFTKELY
jgi:GNAT superfamily N-acetyltransferase